jgi:hypothetical protein
MVHPPMQRVKAHSSGMRKPNSGLSPYLRWTPPESPSRQWLHAGKSHFKTACLGFPGHRCPRFFDTFRLTFSDLEIFKCIMSPSRIVSILSSVLPVLLLGTEASHELVRAYDDLFFGETQSSVERKLRSNIFRETEISGTSFKIVPIYTNIGGTNQLVAVHLDQSKPINDESLDRVTFRMHELSNMMTAKFGPHIFPVDVNSFGQRKQQNIKLPKDQPDDDVMKSVAGWRVDSAAKNISLYYYTTTSKIFTENSFFRKGSTFTSTNHFFSIVITNDIMEKKKLESEASKF